MEITRFNTPSGAHGAAIYERWEDDEGRMWVGNQEYGSQVNYCPFTGLAAKIQVPVKPKYIHLEDGDSIMYKPVDHGS